MPRLSHQRQGVAVGKFPFFLVQGGVTCGCDLSREVLALLGGSFPVPPERKNQRKSRQGRARAKPSKGQSVELSTDSPLCFACFYIKCFYIAFGGLEASIFKGCGGYVTTNFDLYDYKF